MKTKIKHLSKSTISMLLVLLMVVSSVTAGIIATSAAIVDDDSNVGAIVDAESSVGSIYDTKYGLRGSFVSGGWNSDIIQLICAAGNNYIGTYVAPSVNQTNKYQFKLHKDTTWYGSNDTSDGSYVFHSGWSGGSDGATVINTDAAKNFGLCTNNDTNSARANPTAFTFKYHNENHKIWVYQNEFLGYYIRFSTSDNNVKDQTANLMTKGDDGKYRYTLSSTDAQCYINITARTDTPLQSETVINSGIGSGIDSSIGENGGYIKLCVHAASGRTIVYDPSTRQVSVESAPTSDTLVLAGNKALVGDGNSWKNNESGKEAPAALIQNPDSGVYTWTLNDVAASEDLEFRIVKDGTWTSPNGASGAGNYSFTEDSNTNTGSITKAGSDNIKFAITNRSNITFTYKASTGKTTIKAVNSLVEFDGYYLVGRISKYTDESRATEESAAEGRTDTDGQYYPGKWYFSSNSTKLPFTQYTGNANRYYIDTFKTISELSPLDNTGAFGTGTTGQYFAVYDKNRWWGDAEENEDANNFQSKRDYSNAITTAKVEALNSFGKELMFNDKSSNSDGYVRIWIDVSGVTQNTGEGNMKIWYEVINETLPIAKSVTLEASPNETTIGTNISLIARLTDRTAGTSGTELTYTFYDGDTEIGTVTTSENTATLNDITSNFPGVHNYKVVVSTEATYSKTDAYTPETVTKTYRSVQASAIAKFKENNLYVTKDITAADHAASPDWLIESEHAAAQQIFSIDAKDFDYSEGDITDSDSYEFAMSNSAAYDPNFHEYTIDESLNQYCDITLGTKLVTIDGEEVSIRTYIVKPRKNCKNPVIYFNTAADKRTVYAVAEYVGDTSQNVDKTGKTVTYYFAERAGDTTISEAASGTGLRIAAWNSSMANYNNGIIYSDVNTAVKYNLSTHQLDNTSGSNEIYVNTSELYTTNDSSVSGKQKFYVYSVKLPVQMTSFRFVNGSANTGIDTEYLWCQDKGGWEQSDVLNPNRIYLLYNANKEGGNHKKNRCKGVILDEHLWNSDNTTNQVDLEWVKANLINYTDITSINEGNTAGQAVNTSLSSMYSTSGTPYTLYFGNFWVQNSNSLTRYHKYYNLAQSGKESGSSGDNFKMYYSSVQNFVGMTLHPTKKNDMGYSYLIDTQGNDTNGVSKAKVNPLFDYDNLVSEGAASLVKQNIDFPMNKATFNGITTYSYDSTTDYNRLYDASEEKFVVQEDKGSATGFSGHYAYGKDSDNYGYAGFFPFGGNSDKYSNTGFGTEFDMTFYMTNSGKLKGTDGSEQDIMFSFSGDDDVWVYVDGVKVLDLGGDHKVSAGVINFSEEMVYYKNAAIDASKVANNVGTTTVNGNTVTWAADNVNYIKAVNLKDLLASYGVDFKKNDSSTPHTFQMFYMERGAFQSNCAISYTLPMASGLNVKSVVTTDNVNPGLVEATLKSANKDYFNYSMQTKITSNADYEVLRNKYSTASEYNSDYAEAIDLTSPLYPYWYPTLRLVEYSDSGLTDDSYQLSKAGSKPTGNDSKSTDNQYNNSQFKNVATNVYTIGDTNLVPHTQVEDGETKTYGDVTGRTDTNGSFNLLYGQTAKFENKILPYSLVSIKQNQSLGTVDTTGDVLGFTSTTYKTGDYYLTSYSIYDERSMSYVVKPQQVKAQNTNDIIAYDTTNTVTNPENGTKSFYFASYKNNNDSNPSMTVTFTNDVAVGTLRVEKAVSGVAKAGDKFRFKVYFANVFGDTRQTEYREMPDLVYYIYNAGGSLAYTTPRTYGSGIVLEAGQYAEIQGVPVETAYQVYEVSKSGYTLTEIDKTVVKPNGAKVDTSALGIDLTNSKFKDDPATGDDKVERKADEFYNEKFDPRDVTIDNLPTDCAGGTTKAKYEAGTNLTYYVNMIPTITETLVDDFRNYVSVSNVKFTNEGESFKVRIRYYDRKQAEGSYAQIDPAGTYFDVKINNYTDYIVSDDETGDLKRIKFKDMIKSALTNFVLSDIITNEVDDYIAWSSQADAVGDSGIKTYTNAKTGETYTSTPYHTDYISQPQISGQKWVNYFTNTIEGDSIEEADIDTPEKYESIKGITVWCFNTPKTYDVKVHYAKSAGDLNADSTKNINGTNVTINVAKGDTKTYSFYYNQRFGKVSPDPKANEVGFMEQYDKVGYTNYFPNNSEDFASEIGEKKFIYWAYDAAGQQVASTDPLYAYRVTKPFDLYAVYGSEVLSEDVYGLTIFDNATESYVEDGTDGVPVKKTRINTIFNAYNLVDFDLKLRRPALINIFLSKQIRLNPTYWTDARINELFEKYKDQLKTLLTEKGGVSYFKQNQAFSTDVTEFNLTLTTYGYVYAAEKSIDTGVSGLTTATLTNKNRMQFVTKYTTKDLHPDYTDDDKNNKRYLNKNVCFISVGAMYYGTSDSSKWIISDNCLIRRFDSVDVTTKP